MSKYIANEDDIPTNYNLSNDIAKRMLSNIQSEERAEEYEIAKIESPEEIPGMELEDDFNLARKNIENLLNISNNAITSYYEAATSANEPKAMQVLGDLIKDAVEMNKKLVDLHHQRERIGISRNAKNDGMPEGHQGSPTQNNITTQNNIMCSPTDLIKLIKDEVNAEKDKNNNMNDVN